MGAAALTATTLTLQTGCARELPSSTPAEVISTEDERRNEELREMVMATDARVALLEELGTDAIAIGVTADDGNIILEGYVTHDAVRERAQEIIAQTTDAEAIENRVTVRPDRVPDSIWLEDAIAEATLEAAVMHALMEQMGAPAVRIWVEAQDDVVILHGTVDDESQRQQAIAIVERSPGVADVMDDLDTVL